VAPWLNEQGWQPETDRIKARFLVGLGDYASCEALGQPGLNALLAGFKAKFREITPHLVNIGHPKVVGPLIDALYEGSWPERRNMARALIELYHSSKLSEADKRRILQRKGVMTSRHSDNSRHTDNDCTPHTDDTIHTDSGMGLDFPL
jgi:hypothetical protein